MTNVFLIGSEPFTTSEEYKGLKPKAINLPYIFQDVDEIIDELVKRRSFKAHVVSVEKDIEKNHQKYINLSKKYIK